MDEHTDSAPLIEDAAVYKTSCLDTVAGLILYSVEISVVEGICVSPETYPKGWSPQSWSAIWR